MYIDLNIQSKCLSLLFITKKKKEKEKEKKSLFHFLCFGAVVDLSGTLLQMLDMYYEKLGEIYLSDCNQNIR